MESDNDIRSQLPDNIAENSLSTTETQDVISSNSTPPGIKKKNQPGDDERYAEKDVQITKVSGGKRELDL